jgi:hypothetical protein
MPGPAVKALKTRKAHRVSFTSFRIVVSFSVTSAASSSVRINGGCGR